MQHLFVSRLRRDGVLAETWSHPICGDYPRLMRRNSTLYSCLLGQDYMWYTKPLKAMQIDGFSRSARADGERLAVLMASVSLECWCVFCVSVGFTLLRLLELERLFRICV